jgi:hypothetical protein
MYAVKKEETDTEKREWTPAAVQNKDWCFQVRVYNGCCAGLHNKKF